MAISLKRTMATRSKGRVGPAAAKLPGVGKPVKGPVRPPAGYYDPALDASERAAGRGIGDLRIDTETANQRASSGLVTGRSRLGEDKASRLADLIRQRARGLADIGTAKSETTRQYGLQGQSQAEQASAAGVGAGGTLAAALAVRQANEGRDQAGLDLQATRLGEDYTTSVADTNRQFGRANDDIGQDYQYGVDDRALGLARGERENIFFGQDTQAQRLFQAGQAGWTPPAKKKKAPAKKQSKGSLARKSRERTGAAARRVI